MTRNVDPEVLLGFVEEARGYLLPIRQGIDAFSAAPEQAAHLEEAHRLVHTIRGTSAMVGLSALSEAATAFETLLEECITGKRQGSADTPALLASLWVELERLLADPVLGSRPEDSVPAGEPFPPEEAPPPLAASPFTQDEVPPELAEVFALESEDHLRRISALLPALEREPENREVLQEIRRSAHTLKGSAAMVGFQSITQLAHRMEDLLDLLYDGSRPVTPEVVQLLFRSHDALEDLAARKADARAVAALYARYGELLGQPAGVSAAELPVTLEVEESTAEVEPSAKQQGPSVRVPLERVDELIKLVSELVVSRSAFEQRLADFALQAAELQVSSNRIARVATTLETQYEASALGGRLPLPGNSGRISHHNLLPATFETHGFDDLEFDRYTEFHLLSRQLAESTSDVQTIESELGHLHGDFDGFVTRQARLVSEIEDKLMRLRMVPLHTLSSRLHRTVRNVAESQGKDVELVVEGDNTELDKTVLEAMADPLLHLLRNAVDHGIETAEVRRARGKPERGTIRLRAYHEGSQVIVQVSDDGAGIDAETVRAAAVERGFVSAADAARMPAEELLALVFLPGFSTAREVSEVSGRGVGLDIVKAHVQQLKGTLSLDTRPGEGTTFIVRLPMTLAITRALLVKAHHETFAVPLDSIRQILRLEADNTEQAGDETVLRVGAQVYPLVSLGKVLGLRQPADEAVKRRPVVVVHTGSRPVALMVDQLLGGREIVIKNLGSHLRRVPGVTGATLMGDGSVVLILNPAELLSQPARPRPPVRTMVPGIYDVHQVLNVMVVDDSPSVRRVVSNLLRKVGWKAMLAKDGLDALEQLQQTATPPDLLLLDVEMPRMDGYDLLTALKAQEELRDLPVVMITSRAGDKHRRKAFELGASAYLVKPYQDEALLDLIRQLTPQQ
jgi:chemosensory pili system protein ChpA (sensor histidine kinase/response regulator)